MTLSLISVLQSFSQFPIVVPLETCPLKHKPFRCASITYTTGQTRKPLTPLYHPQEPKVTA